MKNIFAGLDLGSRSIRIAAVEVDDERDMRIVGIGEVESKGIDRGMASNMRDASACIRAAVDQAELMSGYDIREIVLGISGEHVQGFNSKGAVPISDKGDHIVSQSDVDRVIQMAETVNIGRDRSILHTIPHRFTVDDHSNIVDPIGMSGVRLEIDAHIITALSGQLINLCQCANDAGVKVKKMASSPLAASYTALSSSEKKQGALLIDIGEQSTTVLLYQNGAPFYLGMLKKAGALVTNDLAIEFTTTAEVAEALKISRGCCCMRLIETDHKSVIPKVGQSVVEKSDLQIAEVIEANIEELLDDARELVQSLGHNNFFNGGIVITGGTANLPGMSELTKMCLGIASRIGSPIAISGDNERYRSPEFSTAVGLAMYGAKAPFEAANKPKSVYDRKYPQIIRRILRWYRKFFI